MVRIKTLRNKYLRQYREFLTKHGFVLEREWSIGPQEAWLARINDEKFICFVLVMFEENFPYSPPDVYIYSKAGFIKKSRHQNEIYRNMSKICLYNSAQWDINTKPQELYDRIAEWIGRSRDNNWKNIDKLDDLYFHYKTNDILVLNSDDFSDFKFKKFGFYNYVEIKNELNEKFLYIFNPYEGIKLNGKKIKEIPLNTQAKCDFGTNLLEIFKNQSKQYGGLWFYLEDAPNSFRTYNEFISEIKRLTAYNRAQIQEKIKLIENLSPDYFMITLVYKEVDDDNKFVHFKIEKTTKNISAFLTSKCDEENFSKRIEHLKTKLRDKTVLIYGIGAIGSAYVDSLSKLGLKKIILSDFDKIEPSNILRHRLGINYIGTNKAIAMKDYIEKHTLGQTIISTTPSGVIDIPQEVNVVVDCTANKNFSLYLNKICIEENKPLIIITSHNKASFGQIKVIRPHVDPCLCCYSGKNGIIDNYKSYNFPYIKDDDSTIITSCGQITYPAISPDIELIALQGVKMTADFLQEKLKYNYCLIVNEDIEDNETGLKKNSGIYFYNFNRIEGCVYCGN